jgi:hypothetical protein
MESMEIKAILESSGIPAVTISASMMPNLPFEVRVSKDHAEQALILIAEAQAAGPAAADEAERAGEQEA